MKFSLKEPISLEEVDGSVNIDQVQLMRAGSFRYFDDTLEITTDIFREMKKNFDNNARGIDLAVDYFHDSYGEAAGWITDIELREGDTELWMSVEWTDKAREKIMSKEIRYLSADFNLNYTDNESGEKFGAVLNGAGLTNRPFIKGMNPILHDIDDLDLPEEKRQAISRIINDEHPEKGKTMKFDELLEKAKAANLTDEQKVQFAEAMGIQLSEDKPEGDKDRSAEDTKLAEENKELKAKLERSEKEKEFEILMHEGKAVEAQKESFLKGDMVNFVKLSQPVNLEGKGSGNEGADEPEGEDKDEVKTREEAEDKIVELAEKMAEDKKITFGEAQKRVLRENKKLADLYNG